MRIDAHQHFWIYSPEQYPWIGEPLRSLRRDFLPAHLQPELARHHLGGSIAVQARQTIEESRWLLSLADEDARIKAVVGWVDLADRKVAETLAEFARHPRFAGVRHVVQDEPDDRFLLRPEILRGLGELKQFNLTYDLLVYPRQLPAAIETVGKFPGQTFVLDHIAKPLIRSRALEPWRKQIRELARHPHVSCKVSGLVTEAEWGAWKELEFAPYLDVVFEAFGEDRVMFGSDWPVCLLSGNYEQVVALVQSWTASLSKSAQAKFWGENAARIYGIASSGIP